MAIGIKTGGRKRGTPNKASAAKAAEVVSSGVSPLDFMVSVMRNKKLPLDRRLEAAKSAAPYIHPKLAQISLNSDEPLDTSADQYKISPEKIAAFMKMPPLERARRMLLAIELAAREYEQSKVIATVASEDTLQ